MSNYWKQSLVIGGIYWLISLVLELSGIWSLLLVDLGLSLLLLLFLIPMNKLVPIKWVDKLINRHPIASTMLASVGWLPYFTALLIIIASIAAIVLHADSNDENLAMIMKAVVYVGTVRKFLAIIISFVVLLAVLIGGKSIAGQLDDRYKVVVKSNKPVKDEAVKVVANANKNAVKANTEAKIVTPKAVVKKTTSKKPVAKDKSAKKVAVKKVATKKAVNKKTAVKKVEVKKTQTKKVAAKKPVAKKTVTKKAVKK